MGYILQALKSAENECLKQKMSIVIHTFLTHRQIGECEAFYKILPQLHMKESNIETVYVPTGFEKNRSKFLKQITEEEAKKCQNVVRISNKAGYFTEKPSMLDKFQRIDVTENDNIKRMTYLQFTMKYTSTNEAPKENDLNSTAYCANQKDWQLTEDLNLIVTHDFLAAKIHYSLPKYIKLVNLKPGEPKYMKKRSRCVARFHKINKIKFPHEYYFSQLQLYSEFRNERELMPDDFDGCKLLYEERSDHNGDIKVENV